MDLRFVANVITIAGNNAYMIADRLIIAAKSQSSILMMNVSITGGTRNKQGFMKWSLYLYFLEINADTIAPNGACTENDY
jgi:hypothetical protein